MSGKYFKEDRLAKGLRQPAKTASVVRILFRILKQLPVVTLKSTKFGNKKVVSMRNCLQNAQSPEELLFLDLPKCFGLDPFMQDEERAEDMESFFEQLNGCLGALQAHATQLKEKCRDQLLKKCGLPGGDEGWSELGRRASWMAPRIDHQVLTPFLNRINNGIEGEHSAQPALSLVANRPFEQWTDIDVERFPGLADGIGDLFQQAWQNYGDSGPDLTAKELEQKKRLRKEIKPHLDQISKNHSQKALAAALRELLIEIEKDSVR